MASKLGRTYRVPKRSLDLLLWATRTRDDISLRDYTGEEIAASWPTTLDDEAAEIAGASPPPLHDARSYNAALFRRLLPDCGLGLSQGGSGFLLSLCARGQSARRRLPTVLLEAERNIQAKLGKQALRSYHRLLLKAPLIVAPVLPNHAPAPLAEHRQRQGPPRRGGSAGYQGPLLLTLDRQLNFRSTGQACRSRP